VEFLNPLRQFFIMDSVQQPSSSCCRMEPIISRVNWDRS